MEILLYRADISAHKYWPTYSNIKRNLVFDLLNHKLVLELFCMHPSTDMVCGAMVESEDYTDFVGTLVVR